MIAPRRLWQRSKLKADAGFTLIELTVSLAILSIVMVLAFSVMISTQNLTTAIGWQSSSNAQLRQLLDDVFADLETARPPFGCDANNDGRLDATTETSVTGACGEKMIERKDAVLLVAGPTRICYYSNRLQVRTTATTVASAASLSYNPAYVPLCLAVVGSTLRLETYDKPASNTVNWNRSVTSGSAPTIHVLGTIDNSVTQSYFQYFQADTSDGTTKGELTNTGLSVTAIPPAGELAHTDMDVLTDAQRGQVYSVSLRVRLGFKANGAKAAQTKDLSYRVTLRAARYAAERCGTGNVDPGAPCA